MSDLGIPFPDLWLWFPHQKSLIMKHSQPFTKTNKNLCSIKAILFETMVLKWLALKSHPRYSSIWSCSQKFRQTMLKHCTKLGEMKPIQLSIWQLDIFHCEKKRKNDPLSNHHGFSQNCHNCTATSVGTSRKLRDCLDDFSDGPNSTAPFQHQEVVGSFRRSTSANLGEHWYVSSSFLLVVVSRCFTSSYKKVSKNFKVWKVVWRWN